MSIRKVVTEKNEIKWHVRIRTNGRGSTRLNRVFDKKIEAEAFLKAFHKAQLEHAELPVTVKKLSERTLKEEADYWLEFAKVEHSPGHVKRMLSIYNQIIPKFGAMTLDKITFKFLNDFKREEQERGLANSTINRNIQIFTTVLNHSFRHKRISVNPAAGIPQLKAKPPEVKFWEKSEAISFLKFTDGRYPKGSNRRWVFVVYLTALNTGLRAGEIWGLNPSDISTDTNTIIIRRQFNLAQQAMTSTKGNANRVVPCNRELKSELNDLISRRNIDSKETIFMNESRLPIDHNNFIKRFFDIDLEDWIKETSNRPIRFHDLRHTATTLLISEGVDLKTVKEICGHSKIETTMLYAHLVGRSIENVARSFSISFNKEEGFPEST